MSLATTKRHLCWIALGGQEWLGGSGWCDLTKLEGKTLKTQLSFKGLWTVVREAIYRYKSPVTLKRSFI